jgi:hypothetical protein
VFQGVHETICYGPGEKPWGENEPRINQIVFIGRGLNRKSLMMGFKCAGRWGWGSISAGGGVLCFCCFWGLAGLGFVERARGCVPESRTPAGSVLAPRW